MVSYSKLFALAIVLFAHTVSTMHADAQATPERRCVMQAHAFISAGNGELEAAESALLLCLTENTAGTGFYETYIAPLAKFLPANPAVDKHEVPFTDLLKQQKNLPQQLERLRSVAVPTMKLELKNQQLPRRSNDQIQVLQQGIAPNGQ